MNTAVATLPAKSTSIISAKGNHLGTRYFFGSMSAKDIKETGRALGFKGTALSKYVNGALRDEKANRAVQTAAAVAALNEAGYVADKVDRKEKVASISFVKVKEAAPRKESGKVAKLVEMLKAHGLSDADIAAALTK